MSLVTVRRHGSTLLLVGVALLLTLYLVVSDRGQGASERDPARARNIVPHVVRGDINAISVAKGLDRIELRRRVSASGDTSFELEGERADQSAVDKLLATLEFATYERQLSEPLDRAQLGLITPRARIELSLARASTTIAVGETAPAPAGASYVEVRGAGVFVVDRDTVTELTRELSFYRERSLLPFALASIERVEVSHDGAVFALQRGSAGGYTVDERGRPVRVDRAAEQRVMAALADLRAETWLAAEDAERAIRESSEAAKVVVTPARGDAERGAVVEISFGSACPGHESSVVAVRRAPAPRKSTCVPRGAADVLLHPPELADPHLFALRSDEVEEVEIVGATKIALVRLGTGWHVREPRERAIDNAMGQGIVAPLLALRGEYMSDGDVARLDSDTIARGRIELSASAEKDAPVAREVVEWREVRGSLAVQRAQDGAWLSLPLEALQVLDPGELAFRDRRVIDVPLANVKQVAVSTGAMHQVITRGADGGLVLRKPNLAIDAGIAHDIADALTQLDAVRWVGNQAQALHGLAAPTATIELTTAEDTVRLEVGRATEGGVFARRIGVPGIFVLSQTTRDLLTSWAVDRGALMLEDGDPRSLLVEQSGHVWKLTREEGANVGGGDAGDLRAKRGAAFERLLGMLRELRAQGAIHPGPATPDEGFGGNELRISASLAAGAPHRVLFGGEGRWRGAEVVYARRAGVDATFAVAARTMAELRALLAEIRSNAN